MTSMNDFIDALKCGRTPPYWEAKVRQSYQETIYKGHTIQSNLTSSIIFIENKEIIFKLWVCY